MKENCTLQEPFPPGSRSVLGPSLSHDTLNSPLTSGIHSPRSPGPSRPLGLVLENLSLCSQESMHLRVRFLPVWSEWWHLREPEPRHFQPVAPVISVCPECCSRQDGYIVFTHSWRVEWRFLSPPPGMWENPDRTEPSSLSFYRASYNAQVEVLVTSEFPFHFSNHLTAPSMQNRS